jgi:uncharacterized membrane protein
MKNRTNPVRRMVTGALIAAVYAAATYAAAAMGLAYAGVQFRFSEALCILPVFTPAAIPGLTVGCVLANLASPLGIVDIICGSAATLLASVTTYLLRNVRAKGIPWLAALPPVIFNSLIVGAEIAALSEGGFAAAFLIAALQVGAGELAVCYGLGIPLFLLIEKNGLDRRLFK